MVSRPPKKRVTVRTSGKSNTRKTVTVHSSGKSNARKRNMVKGSKVGPSTEESLNDVSASQDSAKSFGKLRDEVHGGEGIEKKSERISLVFLGVFIAALFFVLGTGFGNSTGKSLVDGAIDKLIVNSTVAVDRETLERAAIEGALKASGDDWANYFPVSTLEELNNSTANVLTGIGISIREARSGAIEIASIQEGTPAFKNELQIGDQILAVNGTEVQGSSLATVVALIRGDLGKEVLLRVSRDGKTQTFSLLTERIDVKTVDASQIAPEIAYLSISSFSSRTSSEFYTALKGLKSSQGVVIDLRDNPGGLVEEAVSIAELFIGRGTVVSYRANGEEKIFTASNSNPSIAPVVLLINKGTTSAAEILAGAFQDRNRGVVIGQTSFGKGSVQEFMTLRDGSKLELTVALYLTPSGRTIEGVGISPDLRVSDSEIKIKALQVLGGLSRISTKN